MFKSLNNVPHTNIPRFSTGISDLDWIYGGESKNWGLPKGKISLWSGPSGTGKSRSLITVARSMSSMGYNIIYFQNEVTLSDFRSWVGSSDIPSSFYGSESTSLADQLSDIKKSEANLAIIDSVNQIDEFGNGNKKAIQYIYDSYRAITKATGVHIIFICQLDKRNMIKGGSELLFLADISMDLGFHIIDKKTINGYFTVSVGNKHRYGKMGDEMTTLWRHRDNGAICVSLNRLYDKKWCIFHGKNLIPPRPVGCIGGPINDPVSGAIFYALDPKYYAKKRMKSIQRL